MAECVASSVNGSFTYPVPVAATTTPFWYLPFLSKTPLNSTAFHSGQSTELERAV